jgi:putative phosphoesterase
LRLAIISDIHGNIFALKSVLADIDCREIDAIVCTGDLVNYLPYPNEVIQLIRERGILTIKGNHDQKVANFKKPRQGEFEKCSPLEVQQSASTMYTSYILTDENREYLLNLPEKLMISMAGYDILFVHGSPRGIDEYMHKDEAKLAQIVEQVDCGVVVSGHTHMPYHIIWEGKHLINAGSVGKPKHGNGNSTYVVLEFSKEEVNTEIVEVPYDIKKMIKSIQENPYISDALIEMLLKG